MAASKYTQKWNENELKRRLYAIYKSHFQSSNSEEDEDEEKWTTSIYNCKQCKGTFKYLSLHLKKKPKCGHEYAEEEVKDIRAGIKILAKESKKISRRDYYERNKEDRQKSIKQTERRSLRKRGQVTGKIEINMLIQGQNTMTKIRKYSLIRKKRNIKTAKINQHSLLLQPWPQLLINISCKIFFSNCQK